MTKAKAQRIARRAVHVSWDGPAGRPKDWKPKWVVGLGAGEGWVRLTAHDAEWFARKYAAWVRATLVDLLTGKRPRKHDAHGWLTDRYWNDLRKENATALKRTA